MTILRRSLEMLSTLNSVTCVVGRNLAGFILMLMVLVVKLQIVFRYLLNDSLIWTEEVARTMMVWTAFLVAPWGYRVGSTIRIDFFAEELSPRFRLLMNLSVNALICWVLVVFLKESFGFWSRGLLVRLDSLPIQAAWFYSIVPLALFALLLVGFELMLRNMLSLVYPAENFLLPRSQEAEGREQ